MKGLFWRVFVWYLATTAVLLAIALGILMLTDPEFNMAGAVSVSRDLVQNQAESAARLWEKSGRVALRASFERSTLRRFLFDSNGRELSGVSVPANVQALFSRTQSSSAIELDFLTQQTYAAIRVVVGGRPFVFVRVLPQERRFRVSSSPLPGWMRLALGFFTAGFICLLFAHYVTSPLRRLRSATREFAGGHLQVRIGTARPFHRGDEFTDLARDFDNMAARIENLIHSQQRMLGDISHELRSPLARLQLALEIARRRSGGTANEPLDRIEQEADRMNALIGQILRSVKAELVQPGQRKLFDLSNLVREVAQDADFEAGAKNRRVIVRSSDITLVKGDRELLRSAIENVVRNAIRYTPDESRVTIDLRKLDAAHAVLTVSDCGPGVPEDALPHLFEPFYRVNDARDRDSGGAGLGLAITRHVVSVHGGSVKAANRESGFEVEIDLPLVVLDAPTRSGIKFRSV